MHIPTVSAFLVVSLPLAYSKTVFIDGSCTVIPGWNDYWSEALSFSNRASERISSNSDVDFHNIFAKIFKTDIGSADGQNVKSK
jgi:hypothetical protein